MTVLGVECYQTGPKAPQKRWSGANFLWSEVELVEVFVYFFYGVVLKNMDWSAPKHPLYIKTINQIIDVIIHTGDSVHNHLFFYL